MLKLVHINDEAMIPLCNAIIAQAVKDYTTDPESYNGLDAKRFFESEWFYQISDGMDGEAITARLDRKMLDFQELCENHKPQFWKDTEEAYKCQFRCPFCGGLVKIQWNGGHSNYTGRKTGGIMTYTHQCDSCGVRQTYPFIGVVPDARGGKTCNTCQWYNPKQNRQSRCTRRDIHTTSTSYCNYWIMKVYER